MFDWTQRQQEEKQFQKVVHAMMPTFGRKTQKTNEVRSVSRYQKIQSLQYDEYGIAHQSSTKHSGRGQEAHKEDQEADIKQPKRTSRHIRPQNGQQREGNRHYLELLTRVVQLDEFPNEKIQTKNSQIENILQIQKTQIQLESNEKMDIKKTPQEIKKEEKHVKIQKICYYCKSKYHLWNYCAEFCKVKGKS